MMPGRGQGGFHHCSRTETPPVLWQRHGDCSYCQGSGVRSLWPHSCEPSSRSSSPHHPRVLLQQMWAVTLHISWVFENIKSDNSQGSTRTVPVGKAHTPSTLSSLPFLGCFFVTGGAGGLKGVMVNESCWLQDPDSYFNSETAAATFHSQILWNTGSRYRIWKSNFDS